MSRIVKLVAGVEEEEERPARGAGAGSGGSRAPKSWAEQLERSFASSGGGGSGGGGSAGSSRRTSSTHDRHAGGGAWALCMLCGGVGEAWEGAGRGCYLRWRQGRGSPASLA